LSAGLKRGIETVSFRRVSDMLRVAVISAVALTMLTLTACNTVKGLGRDIESVGQAGENAL